MFIGLVFLFPRTGDGWEQVDRSPILSGAYFAAAALLLLLAWRPDGVLRGTRWRIPSLALFVWFLALAGVTSLLLHGPALALLFIASGRALVRR